MKFVEESIIDKQVEALNGISEDAFRERAAHFTDQQNTAFSYLITGGENLLTENEKQYQFYLALIIWYAVSAVVEEPLADLDEEFIGKVDEDNWEIFNATKGKSFHDKLNVFFDEYPQEDLLAFVEDALAEEDEEDDLSAEGRPLIFVQLKTLIDCWTAT